MFRRKHINTGHRISLRSSIEQGLLGIVDTGFPIFLVNLPGGIFPAIIAGLYQSALTFVMVLINTLIFQFFHQKGLRFLSVCFPAVLSTGMAYALHATARSPRPVYSAILVFVMSIWYFTLLTYLSEKFGTISVTKLSRIFWGKYIKRTGEKHV